jgi:hypothetical protein
MAALYPDFSVSSMNSLFGCYTLGMNSSLRHKVFWFYLAATVVSIVILLAFTGAEAYVRWSVNQNFSFLPGAGFEALVVLVLGELLGLAYLLKE